MKFTVSREKLQKALQKVGSIIGSRSMMPILGNVLISAGDGRLRLTTTDLEIRITTTIEAVIEEPGASTAPARKLASLVGCLTGADVSFDIDSDDHVKISCGTGRFTLLGLPAADFPESAEFEAVREVKFREIDFKRMIGSIAYAVSADDSRKVLTGVLFSCRDSAVTLVATDGKRMAMQEKAPEAIEGGDGDCIVPLKAVTEVRRLLEGDSQLTVKVGEKQCSFTGAQFELSTRLIEGNYPNYRAVVPGSFRQTVEMPVALLLAKIETVALLLSENSSFIILKFEENKLTIQASSAEIGEGSDFIELPYGGEPFEVSFNPAFLADPLRNTDAENVRIKLNDPLNPVAMECGEGFLYVIMPIRKK